MSEVPLDLGWIARAMEGTLRIGAPGRPVGRVVTDSRTLEAGDLFVALKGPRFDGQAFVADVLQRGAAGVVLTVAGSGLLWEGAPSAATDAAMGGVIDVEDTLRALQRLGHAVRMASGSRVVAITGSAGKTTTKDAIAEFLATQFRVVKNKGNLNNHIGLPLSLIDLRTGPDVAVVELGMNHAGEIGTLVAIAEPDVRVWTNVGDAHLGFFESTDAIADAKAEILEAAGLDTVLVCNADDARVMARVRRFAGRTVTFGTSPDADVRAREVERLGIRGMRALVTTAVGDARIETPLLGIGNLSNVLAATATAIDMGVPIDRIADRARTLEPAARRGAVRRLRDDVIVIDDSYNSSPSALQQALAVIGVEEGSRRKVAVIGEMLELGAHARSLHEACGRHAVGAGVSVLYAIGGEPARALAAAAVAAGLPPAAVHVFATSEEAAPVVAAHTQPGDLVLVKGSRGVGTDRVVDRLCAELA